MAQVDRKGSPADLGDVQLITRLTALLGPFHATF